jgi:hypothetical protein
MRTMNPRIGRPLSWLLPSVLVLGCTGEPTSRAQFVSTYCELVRPCCGEEHLATDDKYCRAVIGGLTPTATFSATAGETCLAAIRSSAARSQLCRTDDDANQEACDAVFAPGRRADGRQQPGARCDRHEDCAPSPDGEVVCAQLYLSNAWLRTCQVLVPGNEGDAPCLTTIPGPVRFPFPAVLYASAAVPAVTNRYPRGEPPGPPPPRAYVCDPAQGLRCEDQSGRCARPGEVGDVCSNDRSCVPAAHCDLSARRCQPRQPVGQPCTLAAFGTSSCEQGAFCDPTAQTCRAQVPVGQSCRQDAQCRSGACVNETCERNDLGNLGAFLVCGL